MKEADNGRVTEHAPKYLNFGFVAQMLENWFMESHFRSFPAPCCHRIVELDFGGRRGCGECRDPVGNREVNSGRSCYMLLKMYVEFVLLGLCDVEPEGE